MGVQKRVATFPKRTLAYSDSISLSLSLETESGEIESLSLSLSHSRLSREIEAFLNVF